MVTTNLPPRPLRGSRISSFYPVKQLPALSSLDSAFQLQEYISLLIRCDVHDVDRIVSLPTRASSSSASNSDVDNENEDGGQGQGQGQDGKEVVVDEACWIYEQLRRLAQDLTHPLLTSLQLECSRQTCAEMKAGEWLYLCVAHGEGGGMEQCCAIDYILHTLDSATALLNSPRAFPSRLQIPPTSHRHFSSLARRLGRIFAHAYFHHREAFEQAEAESSLYARFLALTSRFDLVPAEFLVIPPGSSRLHGRAGADEEGYGEPVEPPRLLSASVQHLSPEMSGTAGAGEPEKERAQSKSPPGNGNGSKIGRNRTDTMVYSDGPPPPASVSPALEPTTAPSAPVEETNIGSESTEPEVALAVEAAPVIPPQPDADSDVGFGEEGEGRQGKEKERQKTLMPVGMSGESVSLGSGLGVEDEEEGEEGEVSEELEGLVDEVDGMEGVPGSGSGLDSGAEGVGEGKVDEEEKKEGSEMSD